MAIRKITAKAQGENGPYTYRLYATNGCEDFTISDREGGSSINDHSYQSNNNIEVFTIQWDDTKCFNADLGAFWLQVTTADCKKTVSKVIPNPCLRLTPFIDVEPIMDGTQILTASVVNGQMPFIFKWEVTRDGQVEEYHGQEIELNRNDGKFLSVILYVTDDNGCTQRATKILPSVGENPIAQSGTFLVPCEFTEGELKFKVGIVGAATDPDGTIDPSTVEIVKQSEEVEATIEGDQIVYIPQSGGTGVDTIQWRVQDNNGNWSNTATIHINYKDCEQAPIAYADSVILGENQDELLIYPLTNDDPGTGTFDTDELEIVSGPVNGSAVMQAGGVIKYTRPEGFAGNDVIFYRIKNTHGLESVFGDDQQLGVLGQINIQADPKCKQHAMDLSVGCSNNQNGDADISLSRNGAPGGLTIDTESFQYDVGNGWQNGTQFAITPTCVEDETAYVNQPFTTQDGNFSTGQNGSLTITPLSQDLYRIEMGFGSNIPGPISNALQDFIDDTEDNVVYLNISYDGDPVALERNGIVVVDIEDDGFIIDYAVEDITACNDQTWKALIQDFHDQLDALNAATTYDDAVWQRCQTINNIIFNEFKTKLAISFTDNCGDFSVERTYQITDKDDPCGSLEKIEELYQNQGEGQPSEGDPDFELNESVSNLNTINALVDSSGSNILGKVYDWPDDINDFETDVQNYLDINGGGVIEVFAGSGFILIVFRDVTGFTPDYITTNVGNLNFDSVQGGAP